MLEFAFVFTIDLFAIQMLIIFGLMIKSVDWKKKEKGE